VRRAGRVWRVWRVWRVGRAGLLGGRRTGAFGRGAEREGGLDVLAGHRGARDLVRPVRGEAVDEDRELAPGDQRPAGTVRQRLGDERAEGDDVGSVDRRADAAVGPAAFNEAIEAAVDLPRSTPRSRLAAVPRRTAMTLRLKELKRSEEHTSELQ